MILPPLKQKLAHPPRLIVGLVHDGHSHLTTQLCFFSFPRSTQNVPEVLVKACEQEFGVSLGEGAPAA